MAFTAVDLLHYWGEKTRQGPQPIEVIPGILHQVEFSLEQERDENDPGLLYLCHNTRLVEEH